MKLFQSARCSALHSPEHEGTEEGGDDSMTHLLILVVTPFLPNRRVCGEWRPATGRA